MTWAQAFSDAVGPVCIAAMVIASLYFRNKSDQ